jgi:hypothetical protein
VDDKIWPAVPEDPAQSIIGVKEAVIPPVQLIGAGMVQMKVRVSMSLIRVV